MGAKLLLILARKLLQSCRASETCLKKNLFHRSQVQYKQIDCSIAIHLDSQSRIYTVSMQQICSDGIVDALVNVSYRYFCRLKLTELRSSLQSLLEAAFVLICFNAKKTTCFTGNCLGMLFRYVAKAPNAKYFRVGLWFSFLSLCCRYVYDAMYI